MVFIYVFEEVIVELYIYLSRRGRSEMRRRVRDGGRIRRIGIRKIER